MFGNVSRFLIRTGVDEIIGDNLIQPVEVRTWGHSEDKEKNGRLIGHIDVAAVVKHQGFPWWVVRRDHLHAGLAEGARRRGVEMVAGFRLAKLKQHGRGQGVTVISEEGSSRKFDLVIGADGVRSVTRSLVFPQLKPHSASNIAAYRCVVPYKDVFEKIPEARGRLGNTMDAWMGPGGYILLYPLTAGKELNIVTAYEQTRPVVELEEVSLDEFRDHYKGWDPFVLKILNLVDETKRWPLNIIPPVERWSNEERNVVLQGDAAHGMQNHMAQGAATAMEDGIFLGRVIFEVLRETIDIETAIHLYEKKRIPRAFHKQQSAFMQGQMLGVRGDDKRSRDQSMAPEVEAFDQRSSYQGLLAPTYRTSLMFSSPQTVPGILYYDAEGDADFAVDEWLMTHGEIDERSKVSNNLRNKWRKSLYDNGLRQSQRSWGSDSKL